MTDRLQDIIDTFSSADEEMRLELLLDFSEKLPELPERLREQRDAGMNKVPECQAPVFLWIEQEDDGVHIYADVAEEAPTVKGILAILCRAFNGAKPDEVADVPDDLLQKLKLDKQIRMTRMIGITGMLGRIRRQAKELSAAA